jgi:hypothetical protein
MDQDVTNASKTPLKFKLENMIQHFTRQINVSSLLRKLDFLLEMEVNAASPLIPVSGQYSGTEYIRTGN